MSSEEKYNRDWFESLHRNAGWVPVRFGHIRGWQKAEKPASGTRFPFAMCVNDEDEYTSQIYSHWCDSYSHAIILVHAALDELTRIEKQVQSAIHVNEPPADWDTLSKTLLMWCCFDAIFSAPSMDSGRGEIWLVEDSSTISARAYDLCILVLNNKREWLLPYLQATLTDTSKGKNLTGALNFVSQALQEEVLVGPEIADSLADLRSNKMSLPYRAQRILDRCLEHIAKNDQ